MVAGKREKRQTEATPRSSIVLGTEALPSESSVPKVISYEKCSIDV